jgi:hypothetical protein
MRNEFNWIRPLTVADVINIFTKNRINNQKTFYPVQVSVFEPSTKGMRVECSTTVLCLAHKTSNDYSYNHLNFWYGLSKRSVTTLVLKVPGIKF